MTDSVVWLLGCLPLLLGFCLPCLEIRRAKDYDKGGDGIGLRKVKSPVIRNHAQAQLVCKVVVANSAGPGLHRWLTDATRSNHRKVLRGNISGRAASSVFLAILFWRDHNLRFRVGNTDKYLPPEFFTKAGRPLRANSSVCGQFLSMRQTRHVAAWVSFAR
jgi:hypothetical protein